MPVITKRRELTNRIPSATSRSREAKKEGNDTGRTSPDSSRSRRTRRTTRYIQFQGTRTSWMTVNDSMRFGIELRNVKNPNPRGGCRDSVGDERLEARLLDQSEDLSLLQSALQVKAMVTGRIRYSRGTKCNVMEPEFLWRNKASLTADLAGLCTSLNFRKEGERKELCRQS